MEMESIKITYSQPVDEMTTTKIDYANHLTLETADAGGGRYLVIKTKRWTLDDSDFPFFIETLKNFYDKYCKDSEEERQDYSYKKKKD